MNNIGRVLILFLFVFINRIEADQNIPLIIESEDRVLKKLSNDIKRYLPKNIDILAYDTEVMNGNEKIKNNANIRIRAALKNDADNRYSIDFFSELDNKGRDISFLNTYEEEELISFARSLKKDAVMLSSITIFDDKVRKVWSSYSKKFVNKNIGLLQGNIFNTEKGDTILRFSYFFIID